MLQLEKLQIIFRNLWKHVDTLSLKKVAIVAKFRHRFMSWVETIPH